MGERVLWIEADAAARAEVRRALDAAGLEVEERAGVREALERAPAAVPDLVLAALPPPAAAEDGALLAQLRRAPGLSGAWLLAVGPPGERDRALAAGFDGLVPWPPAGADVAEGLRAFLGGRPRARARSPELERVGSDFVRDLAHQLSTPLTPLAGYVKILQAGRLGPLSPLQRKVVDAMASSVVRLTRILDNLSDLASLQAGPAAITRAPVDPDALAEEVVGEARAAARDARVAVQLRPGAAGPVLADRKKLRQALSNLVQNAVKFSPHGGEVLVEVARDGGALRFAVYDQGPGVPPGEVARIFEPFRGDRGGGHEEARPPGSGLGLPVARRIAEAHGGRIVVESPPIDQAGRTGHEYTGSKFVLEIPLLLAGPEAAVAGPVAGG